MLPPARDPTGHGALLLGLREIGGGVPARGGVYPQKCHP